MHGAWISVWLCFWVSQPYLPISSFFPSQSNFNKYHWTQRLRTWKYPNHFHLLFSTKPNWLKVFDLPGPSNSSNLFVLPFIQAPLISSSTSSIRQNPNSTKIIIFIRTPSPTIKGHHQMASPSIYSPLPTPTSIRVLDITPVEESLNSNRNAITYTSQSSILPTRLISELCPTRGESRTEKSQTKKKLNILQFSIVALSSIAIQFWSRKIFSMLSVLSGLWVSLDTCGLTQSVYMLINTKRNATRTWGLDLWFRGVSFCVKLTYTKWVFLSIALP